MLTDPPVRGLTLRAFLIGMALVLAWLLYDAMMVPHPRLGSIEVLYLIGFGAVFTIFAVHALNRVLPESSRLTTQELTVIYAMVAVAIPWGILIRGTIEGPLRIAILYKSKEDPTAQWLTPFWGPTSRDAIQMYRVGGVSPGDIRWRDWQTPMLYWAAMLISFQAFVISLVLFFRELFVERERLPFPLSQVAQGVMEYEKPPESDAPGRRAHAAVLCAFVMGLLFCAPGILSVSHVGTEPIPISSSYYGTTLNIVPGLETAVSWDPFVLCFLMFFPVDVLLTVAVCHVILMIVIPMFCSFMGIPTPDVGVWRVQILGMGGLLGLAFWTMFFNRRYIRGFIGRAFAGGANANPNRPMRARWVLAVMVISFAAFVTLFVIGLIDFEKPFRESVLYRNLHSYVISLIVCLFIIVVLIVAVLRQSGEAGWHYHSPWSVAFVYGSVNVTYLNRQAEFGVHRTPPAFLAAGHALNFGAYHNAFSPHINLMYALRIASDTRTRARDVLIAAVVTLAVSLAIMIPGYLVIIHHYGMEHGASGEAYTNFWNYSYPQHGIAYSVVPSWMRRMPPYIPLTLGVGIIGIVMYLRREYVGFPFSPVGVVITAGLSYFGDYSTENIWLPVIIALVVKATAYKWFGVKFFRERVMPVVAYAMMGLMTGMVIYNLLLIVIGGGILQSQ